jgi:hypothetical protein
MQSDAEIEQKVDKPQTVDNERIEFLGGTDRLRSHECISPGSLCSGLVPSICKTRTPYTAAIYSPLYTQFTSPSPVSPEKTRLRMTPTSMPPTSTSGAV